jgi:hypothetical protein
LRFNFTLFVRRLLGELRLTGRFADGEFLSSDNPFWFASEELLIELLREEIHIANQLFAKYPDLPELFDLPDASVEQRAACFALLAHRNLMNEIYETFAGRHQQSPSLGDEEKDVLKRTRSLFDSDAPRWVLEVNEVAELLPTRMCDALPELLRAGGFGFSRDDPERMRAIQSAINTLSTVEKFRALTERVFNQQLERLSKRWSASISALSQPQTVGQPRTTSVTLGKQMRRMNKREGWEQKLKLFAAIQNALNRNPSLQGIKFCAELDKRHAPPLHDWAKTGEWPEGLTWKEAWADGRLRKKIRRVRQEAMKSR